MIYKTLVLWNTNTEKTVDLGDEQVVNDKKGEISTIELRIILN